MATVTPDHSTSPRKTPNKRVTKEKVRRLIEAAEAAAQADYERRILSALEE